MNIVLHQPEIPHNTGAIGRTCLVTGSALHLIRPYGFHLDEKSLKRAGMDYWQRLNVCEYDSFDDFVAKNAQGMSRFVFAETGGDMLYTDWQFQQGDYIIFGSETAGLPRNILDKFRERVVSIPMVGEIQDRSLNLSVSVGIILFEALRQLGIKN